MKDFIKEHYFKEIERRHQLDNSCTTLISLVSILIALEFTIWFAIVNDSFLFNNCECYIYGLFIFTFFIQLGAFSASLLAYNNLFCGYEYDFVPLYSDFEDVYENKSLSDQDEYFWLHVTSALDVNQINNDKKSNRLYRAKSLFIGSLLPLIIIFCIFSTSVKQNNDLKAEIIKCECFIKQDFSINDEEPKLREKGNTSPKPRPAKGPKSQ